MWHSKKIRLKYINSVTWKQVDIKLNQFDLILVLKDGKNFSVRKWQVEENVRLNKHWIQN